MSESIRRTWACETCRFWHTSPALPKGKGWCRRFPPAWPARIEADEKWPLTRSFEVCGEHQPEPFDEVNP